jgi:hypothetical protein
VLLFGVAVLGAFGSALLKRGRQQRAVDLAAISGARSMRDDFDRLFEPARDSRGLPNPRHLEKDAYLARARQTALEIASSNGVVPRSVQVDFPDRRSFAPLRIRVTLLGSGAAEAELTPPSRGGAASPAAQPAVGSGGGYAGPLSYRQGKPMRPDVATAFDRLESAARRAGLALVISSGYRSDAEQARLFARHPDPRWVAPPGRSLHRNGTELDLGPTVAYGWLHANARRFGFLQRYSWEPWHYESLLHGIGDSPEEPLIPWRSGIRLSASFPTASATAPPHQGEDLRSSVTGSERRATRVCHASDGRGAPAKGRQRRSGQPLVSHAALRINSPVRQQ